ncbi:hypothetical protein ACFL02_08760 [Planctomycetota bacterium]
MNPNLILKTFYMNNNPRCHSNRPQKPHSFITPPIHGKGDFSITRRLLLIFLLAVISHALFGCSTPSTGFFHLATLEPPNQFMQQHFPQRVARINDRGQVACVLTSSTSSPDVQVSGSVQQTLILRSFWLPKRGRTPVTPSGANVNIDYLIETNGQVAIYRGAGFARFGKISSKRNINLDLRSAQIRLDRQTPGFKPTFTLADLTGKAVVVNDPAGAQALLDGFQRKFNDLVK